ncbi:hypothetical protein ABIB81_009194 [Bradyrhizobium sp. I1.7.5]
MAQKFAMMTHEMNTVSPPPTPIEALLRVVLL